jgi:ribosomal protein S1
MLRRLVDLYAVVEEIHSTELQRMTAAVRETELAIVAEQHLAKSTRIDGRDALAIGDRVGWMMYETQQKTAAWRLQRIEQIRQEREQTNDAARQQYMASRLKREQMKQMFDEISARIKIAEGRQTQAASDDRFAARRRWTDVKKKMRADREMKVF